MTAASTPSRPCPICRKPAEAAYKPFCSKRCADVDLQRWFSGSYVIPGEPQGGAEDAPQWPDEEG